jgi:hypothetical protein
MPLERSIGSGERGALRMKVPAARPQKTTYIITGMVLGIVAVSPCRYLPAADQDDYRVGGVLRYARWCRVLGPREGRRAKNGNSTCCPTF